MLWDRIESVKKFTESPPFPRKMGTVKGDTLSHFFGACNIYRVVKGGGGPSLIFPNWAVLNPQPVAHLLVI